MRILILSQFFDPEPAVIQGLPMARWLTQRGHEVEVLTGFPNYPGGHFYKDARVRLWRREEYDGIRMVRVLLYPSHNRSPVRRMANYLSFAASASVLGPLLTRKPDVIYVYHPPATTALAVMVRQAVGDVPFVFHLQDLWPESVVDSGMVAPGAGLRLMSSGIERWCRRVYRNAGAVVTTSGGMRGILTQRGVPADKVRVIPNWADESVFRPGPPDSSLARSLGLEGRFNVMYAGNLGPYQALDVTLHAAKCVQDLTRVQFVVVGTGPDEAKLRDLSKALGLDNVLFLGRKPYDQMGEITGLADAMIVSLIDRPFLSATIPSKTQVALACAKPVIMCAKGDAARIVEESRCGIVCPPGDVDALASAVRRLAQAPGSDLVAMGQAGRDYYERKMSLDQGMAELESVLAEVAGI